MSYERLGCLVLPLWKAYEEVRNEKDEHASAVSSASSAFSIGLGGWLKCALMRKELIDPWLGVQISPSAVISTDERGFFRPSEQGSCLLVVALLYIGEMAVSAPLNCQW